MFLRSRFRKISNTTRDATRTPEAHQTSEEVWWAIISFTDAPVDSTAICFGCVHTISLKIMQDASIIDYDCTEIALQNLAVEVDCRQLCEETLSHPNSQFRDLVPKREAQNKRDETPGDRVHML